jgi:hypothetical protein
MAWQGFWRATSAPQRSPIHCHGGSLVVAKPWIRFRVPNRFASCPIFAAADLENTRESGQIKFRDRDPEGAQALQESTLHDRHFHDA